MEEVIQREEELRRRWLLQEWDHRQGLGVRVLAVILVAMWDVRELVVLRCQ